MNHDFGLDLILATVYWGIVIAVLALGVVCAAVTLRTPRRWLVITAATTIVVGTIIVLMPHRPPVPGVSVLVALAALALSVLGGGPAVLFTLALASRGSVREGAHGGIVVTKSATLPDGEVERGEVLRGGTVIGIFERVAATASIMVGYPAAIAVVVAVKSVGRFTELAAAEARERFIIGTLVSLVWAAACGALFRFVIGA
ncbi:hypothetical protein [Humibacter albus]|uniref:hypothetical protein n=1 Tax=Humibacter albus TaxID=427754 RepID=UPI0003B7ADCC|nr:hypothetical protein [Humibacter albus]